ncbi:hypothetical protein C8C76_11313 [Halanaerobium saccharolyticum]|jgi:hypothetical protein|uniref:Dihydroorotate dehydrogenase n=1 Tax=Halanaerobium saccharolyticum TaxID=43595 RepID=A0A2T5RJM9_9FIRM|nr:MULTISPECIES: DUF2325 domain-containing protein [Halanaerobium]PTV98882.1 hypothetical protein C8C76_11313 [Halanaerobium saccharolyticum]PUU90383.1 MAG: hypothetical protein CI949_2371 [Halanaerobium sp.]TDP88748.1 hypothetical protein C7957_13326 [Halanaerobium saccharolyticum]
MSLMIVGADNLGSIRDNVKNLGFEEIIHLDGRNKSKFRNFEIPAETDFVLVMTDYINHAVMRKVKKAAKASEVSVIYARRSWASIYKKLERRAVVN